MVERQSLVSDAWESKKINLIAENISKIRACVLRKLCKQVNRECCLMFCNFNYMQVNELPNQSLIIKALKLLSNYRSLEDSSVMIIE